MPFIEIEELPGKVYVPERLPDNQKKHKCPDCFSCQMCSNDKCRICLNQHSPCKVISCELGNSSDEDKPV